MNNLNKTNFVIKTRRNLPKKYVNKEPGKLFLHHVLAPAFDLQKVLLCPYGQNSSFYNSQRLENPNFTIMELDNMNTYCYFWVNQNAKKDHVKLQHLNADSLKRQLQIVSVIFIFLVTDVEDRIIITWYL